MKPDLNEKDKKSLNEIKEHLTNDEEIPEKNTVKKGTTHSGTTKNSHHAFTTSGLFPRIPMPDDDDCVEIKSPEDDNTEDDDPEDDEKSHFLMGVMSRFDFKREFNRKKK